MADALEYNDTIDKSKPLWWCKNTRDVLYNILLTQKFVFYKHDKTNSTNYYYMNTPIAFDIENSSFYNAGCKVSTMYVWQFGIGFTVIMGRTWKEFRELIATLNNVCDSTHKCIVYVHNLSHEFQFIRRHFRWDVVFAGSERNPIYAVTDGVEFRDSWILSGRSLAGVSSELTDKTYCKKVGDLDYSLIRGSKTELTEKEIGYCMNDVQVLNEYIKEQIELNENISRIPLTKTGYVRRYVRKKCFADPWYKMLIDSLTISSTTEYNMMHEAFQGGFTHASPLWVGEHIRGRIDSIDFTSSYPFVILSEKYPMSKGRKITIESSDDLKKAMRTQLLIMRVKFIGIRTLNSVYDNIISESRCLALNGGVVQNGRIASAGMLITTITSVDLESISKFYQWDGLAIGTCYAYEKGYLPKPIIESVLDLYSDKTTLKGVRGMETEYMLKKGMLNSIFGMMVQNVIQSDIVYNDAGWSSDDINVEEKINEYNVNRQRFLFYPWGVFVTAYARRNLYSGILEFGSDYLYSDTDSIKCLNLDKHTDYIESYNKLAGLKVCRVLDYYDISRARAKPQTIKGIPKPIGVWDIETKDDPMTDFKTLGAKRYIFKDSEGLHITIAGVGKKSGAMALSRMGNPFDAFNDSMELSGEGCGKLTHTYIDERRAGTLTDYKGNDMNYDELSAVHLEPSKYLLSVKDDYLNYCKGFRTSRRFYLK